MNRTPAVQAAMQKAIDRGVSFSPSYPLPYTVSAYSTRGTNVYSFFWEKDPFTRDEHGFVLNRDEEAAAVDAQLAKQPEVYCVNCNHHRSSGFFFSKEEAEALAEAKNIRHFEIAAMSDNPKFPVLV